MKNKKSKKELTRLILTALILGGGSLYGPVAEADDPEPAASITDGGTSTVTKNNVFDGGAKGQLFEKLVIQKFSPSEKNNYSVNFFGQFSIY